MASRDIDWARVASNDLKFSYAGVADVLATEGWETVTELVPFDLDDEDAVTEENY